MDFQEMYKVIEEDFLACGAYYSAIGNETRQAIIVRLIQAGPDGIRVGDITDTCHLSRPAVSHHLKILKDAGIAHVRKDGTMNYYYLDITELLPALKKSYDDLISLMDAVGNTVKS